MRNRDLFLVERPAEADLPDGAAVVFADKERERRIRSSRLDRGLPDRAEWRPPKGTFRVDDRLPMKGVPYISWAYVGAFLHRAAHSDEWIHRSPVISG